MAANTTTPPQLQRSFSQGAAESLGTLGGADGMSMRSINQKRSIRSQSIVGALWKYLYAPRRAPSSELSSINDEVEETDLGVGEDVCLKQEEAQLQAYYTAVALVVLFVCGILCWAVYCVLEPFLHPLLWAVLTGILLYPVKKTWTERIGQWLVLLELNSIPLSAGLVLSPLFLFNYLSKYIESTIVDHWALLLGSTVATVSLWLLHRLSFITYLYHWVTEFYVFLVALGDMLTNYAISLLLFTLALSVVFAVLLAKNAKEEYTLYLTSLSILVWFLVILNAAAYLLGNTLALPLVIGLFVTGGVVSFGQSLSGAFSATKKKKLSAKLRRKGRDEGKERIAEEGGGREAGEMQEDHLEEVKCLRAGETNFDIEIEREAEAPIRPIMSDPENAIIVDNSLQNQTDFAGPADDIDAAKSHVSFGSVVRIPHTEPPVEEEREGKLVMVQKSDRRLPPPKLSSPAPSDDNSDSSNSSDYIFLGLYCMFFVMLFWSHPFLLILLLPFAIWGALKRIFASSTIREMTGDRLKPIAQGFSSWASTRRPLLFPSPLPTLSQLFLSLDRVVLKFVKGSVDSIISGFIIISLLVSGLGLAVFLVLQIQVELSHYVTMMSAVWESTLEGNPQLAEWIGGGGEDGETQSIKETIGSFATQGYIYGREWLAGQVQSALGDSTEKGGAFEKQVLNLYDQLYQSYVLANTTTMGESHFVHNDGDLLNELKIVVMENLETVVSVLKTMWLVLADNISLAVSLLYTFLGLLLSGGTALLNTVVFLTTLFYLLCYSNDVYLPVKIVTDILPSVTQSDTTSEYTASFSRAIRSVFHASFSRLVFYGLYTWLVHAAFGLPVSILPAVLAAIAGALPFVGTYWIALPAVLELWLVEGETLSAIAVLILSLLPLFFVDSVIYGEVEGGHPYLTGLAVAGGIYFAGLEGALIGPILLCCLVFIHELFGEMFTPTSDLVS